MASDVSSLYELHEQPDLESPALVMALEGWIDAGLGANEAVSRITSATEPATVATFDGDALLDYRARRPVMHLKDGVVAELTWPSIELKVAADDEGRDFLFLVGAEPDHAWKAFSTQAVDLALQFGARIVVGLGAYPAAVAHTRRTQLASTATSSDLAASVGFVRGTIDVPSGVQAAIERRSAEVGLPALGLWAQVPHYAAAMPYPAAAAALLDGLRAVTDLTFDSAELEREAEAARSRLDSLVSESDEHLELVRQLEAHADEAEASRPALEADELPSADELAAQVEEFLRRQDG